MEQINNLLEARRNYLLRLKKEKEKALKSVPDGFLRICRHGKKTQYYHRANPKDFSGVYIREKDIELAKKLAQKDYDQKVLCSIDKELLSIEKYSSYGPTMYVEQIYDSLHKERQKLIKPIEETEEQYINNWKSAEYKGKEFDELTPEIYTVNGERVRSKSEVIIADLLNREGIPYRYEYPIYMKGWGKVYPDFTVLNVRKRKELYWEHFGMMDDSNYVESTIEKIALYEKNGIFPGENLILSFETKKNPINQKIVGLLIKQYLT